MAQNLKDILWYFRYFVFKNNVVGIVREISTLHIHVRGTDCLQSFSLWILYIILQDWLYNTRCLMLLSEGWLPLPIRFHTPTQLTMYCVFHYFDGWWEIILVKLCLLNCVQGWWEISINLCVIIFGNYIIFGQAELLYGLFGFKFYSDYHLNYIYIYYCCFWLVVFCYVLLCISLCVYCKFMCIRMY